MPKVRWVLTVLLMMLTLYPAAAEASEPCAPPKFAAQEAEIILQGQILAEPLPSVRVIRADKYYRGRGPRYVVAEVVKHPTGKWFRRPHLQRSSSRVMGFDLGFGLVHKSCALVVPVESAGVLALGEGSLPGAGVDLRSSLLLVYLLLLGAAGYTLVQGIAAVIRRLRRR